MTDTANAMLSVVGCLAALYHQRRTGEGQELWTSLLDGARDARRPTRCSSTATPCPRPQLDADQTGIDACYRLYETIDGWIQIAAVGAAHWSRRCATRSACPSSSTTPRFADRAARARAPPAARSAARAARSRRAPAIVWSRVLDDAGVPNEIPRDTQRGRGRASSTPTTNGSGSSPSTSTRSSGACGSSATLIDFSETPGHIARPAAARRRAHQGDPRLARLRRGADAGAEGRGHRLLARRRLRLDRLTARHRIDGCDGGSSDSCSSSYFITLPVEFSGNASTTSTRRGTL